MDYIQLFDITGGNFNVYEGNSIVVEVSRYEGGNAWGDTPDFPGSVRLYLEKGIYGDKESVDGIDHEVIERVLYFERGQKTVTTYIKVYDDQLQEGTEKAWLSLSPMDDNSATLMGLFVTIGDDFVVSTPVDDTPKSPVIVKAKDPLGVKQDHKITESIDPVKEDNVSKPALEFIDANKPLDISVGRLYTAAFGRTPDEAGFLFWRNAIQDSVINYESVSTEFASSAEFLSIAQLNSSSIEFTEVLYLNVLVRQTRSTSRRHLGWTIRTKASRAKSDACGGWKAQSRQRQTKPRNGQKSKA